MLWVYTSNIGITKDHKYIDTPTLKNKNWKDTLMCQNVKLYKISDFKTSL